jgi:hypothetical protein
MGVFISRMMRYMGHMAHMEGKGKTCRVLMGKSEGKIPL